MTKPVFYDLDPGDFLRSFPLITRTVITDPQLFFLRMKQNGGLKNPTLFLLVCTLFHTVMVSFFISGRSFIIAYLVSGIAAPFLIAGIVQYALKTLFQAAGPYEAIFRINAYASALALLSWIPVIGFMIELYRLYIISYGLSRIFQTGLLKCLAVVLIAIIVTAAIYIPIAHALGLGALITQGG